MLEGPCAALARVYRIQTEVLRRYRYDAANSVLRSMLCSFVSSDGVSYPGSLVLLLRSGSAGESFSALALSALVRLSSAHAIDLPFGAAVPLVALFLVLGTGAGA